ncbi:MAG: hypothetical protein HY673_07890 [Chloroflexi bacterium]|nr:hypothetical protein [Chloroflexota bacterium]
MPGVAKTHGASQQALLQLRIQSITDPEIASYIESLKKKYKKYAMPADEARKVVDAAMGKKTLTELLYEARGQAS